MILENSQESSFGFDLQITLAPVIHLTVQAANEEQSIQKIKSFLDKDVDGIFHTVLVRRSWEDFEQKNLTKLIAHFIEYPDSVTLHENLASVSVWRHDSETDESRKIFSNVYGYAPDAFLDKASWNTYGNFRNSVRRAVVKELHEIGVTKESLHAYLNSTVIYISHELVSNLQNEEICLILCEKSFLLEREPESCRNFYDYFSDTAMDSPISEIEVNLMAYLCCDLMEEFESEKGLRDILSDIEGVKS